MQESNGTTLKEIASKLGINYSSAKTIIQTFRKEKRFIKKDKKQINTMNSKKKEKILRKLLNSKKCLTLFSKIINDFYFEDLRFKNQGNMSLFPSEAIISNNANNFLFNSPEHINYISRINSSDSMQNLISDPLYSVSSVSIGINTELDQNIEEHSKDIFFVHNSDENFQDNLTQIDKSKTNLFASKKRKLLPCLSKEDLLQLKNQDIEIKKNEVFEAFVSFHSYRVKIWNSFWYSNPRWMLYRE